MQQMPQESNPTDDYVVKPSGESLRRQVADLLAKEGRDYDGDDPWWAIAASQPKPAMSRDESAPHGPSPTSDRSPRSEASARASGTETVNQAVEEPFVPMAPKSFEASGLSVSEVEALVFKFLLNRGIASGRQIAQQVRLPFGLVAGMLRRNKEERLLVYRGEAAMTDYMYELTELGIERARRYSAQCTYFGAAPVPLDQYTEGVKAQSVRKQQPRMTDMERAFADLVLSEAMLIQLGQAISSGLGVFLYGAPGNGKTSIAERVTDTLGDAIWIPRAISISGEIIRLYDPISHQACSQEDESQIDERWIRIRRPTILVGGELTMENLEITTNVATGINEAPLQLKANGGVLVLDDFGRQRISPIDLLNRWIVPLEKRHDYLNLPSGRKIEVPFDELIIFATNLEPQSLVDEAFLRRIPYKIDVTDPTDAEFRALFRRSAEEFGMEYSPGPIDYLIQRHYKTGGRPMRFCHPRDLVHHMQTFCKFLDLPLRITNEAVDAAVKNYFAMI